MNDYFKKLQEDRIANAKVLEKPSMGGVRNSVVEKYTEQAHFIYELLQNADDVKATKASFILEEEGLIFIHNGKKKFSVSNLQTEKEDQNKGTLGHINAITSIGNSSKKIEQQIGKFGVGFKAVFQYTNTPQVYEDEYKFEIQRFIVPHLIEKDHKKRPPHHTLFYFPFDNPNISKEKSYKEIDNRLQNLDSPLLFINHLQEIQWETTTAKGAYTKKVRSELIKNDIEVTRQTTSKTANNETIEEQSFLVFTQKIAESAFDASIAYLLKDAQTVDFSKQHPAFCFFPTREQTNLRFIIQAPFLLIDNRQGIKRGNEWNEKIIQQLANLTAESIPIVKELGLLKDDFFNALPIQQNIFDQDDLYWAFIEKTFNKLSGTELLLPTKEGNFTNRYGAYLANSSAVLGLFSSEQLALLFDDEKVKWVFPTLIGSRRRQTALGNFLFDVLNIRELDINTLLNRLHIDFLQSQTDEWLFSFYEYLADVSYVWTILMNKPIIRTENNEQLSPLNAANELQVFLPSELKSEFPTVKKVFLESEKCKRLFEGLKIREADLKAEIEVFILPQYRGKEFPEKKHRGNHFELFYAYYLQCSKRELFEYISKLQKKTFIESIKEDKKYIVFPKEVYFRTEPLQVYFNNSTNIYWLNEDEYEVYYEKYGKEAIITFLKDLGVNETPRQGMVILNRYQIPSYKKSQKLKLLTDGKAYYLRDYQIEHLEENLQKLDRNLSVIIWNFLSESLDLNNFETKLQYHYKYYRDKYQYKDAYFIRLLKSKPWLFETKNNAPLKPSEISLEALEKNYPIDSLGNRKLIELLGIRKAKKAWEKDFTKEELKEIYLIAQRAKGYTKEDFAELERVKKRRLITQKQEGNPLSKRIKDIVKETDLNEINREIEEFEEFIKKTSNSPYLEETQNLLFEIKSKFVNVQEKVINQQQLVLNLMTLKEFSEEFVHSIKNSLTNINNRVIFIQKHLPDFVEKKLPNPRYEGLLKTYANDIEWEITNLDKVSDFILNYATVEDNLETFDVKEVIENVFDYNARSVLDENQINYEVVIERSLSIHYNRKAFEDIIENLISNSVKALDDIENKQIRCRGTVEAHKFVLYFSDNGCGIKKDRKEKIFDIYETSTRKQGGSGIGLFTVKTRLKSLNGDIKVVENEFKPTGATFKITLPFKNRKK